MPQKYHFDELISTVKVKFKVCCDNIRIEQEVQNNTKKFDF
ncbi:MAG: hypothetical protein RIT43_2468 [Bacteroidota bacterium]|jgi:hypothetical protein